MPLDFPLGVTVGQTYLNWTFDGARWVITPDARAPFVSRAGDEMQGALEVMLGTPPGDDDATPKKYVDDAIASGALYQGTWVALTNVPDLSGTSHQNGWAWVVITSDPHLNEATGVAIPGLPAGTMVGNGDRIVWNAGSTEFELIHSPGMTQAEADDRYLQLIGGTLANPGSLTVAGNFAAEAGTALAALAGSVVIGTNTGNPTANLSVQQDATIGRNISLVTDNLVLPLNLMRRFDSISSSPFTSLAAFVQDRNFSFRATLSGATVTAWPDLPIPNVAGDIVFLDVQKWSQTATQHSRFVKYEVALRKFWNYMQAAGTWAGWQEISILGPGRAWNATVLLTGTDLNNLVTPGRYGSFDFDDVAAPVILNMPIQPNWACVVEVLGNVGSRVTQRFTAIGHGNHPTEQRTFTRGRIDVQPWSAWRPVAMLGDVDPQPWYFYRAGGYNWTAPLTGYYNLIAAGPGGGGCNWVGAAGSAARYWCGGSGGIAGRRLLMQAGEILSISVPRGGYPAGGTGAQGAANFGPITDAGGGYQSTVINSANYNSPGMPPGWTNRSLWIVAQFGLSGWNTTPNAAYVEAGSGITVFAGYGPGATGTTPGQPRGMALGSGTRQIIAQSGRGGSYMEAGGDGMAAISYDGPS